MAKKDKTPKDEKVEREYVIPLRRNFRKVPRYKRANKAVKTVKEFLVRHMKIYDRDLRKIKIDFYLNEYLWFRGIKNPPFKVKVKAIKDPSEGIVRVELVELPEKLKFKKAREEKIEEKAKKALAKKKPKQEPAAETKPGEKTEEQKAEEKEKKTAVVEAGKELEKAAAKTQKHMAKMKVKEPKRQQRVALQK